MNTLLKKTLIEGVITGLRQFSTKPLFYSDISPLIVMCCIFIVSNHRFIVVYDGLCLIVVYDDLRITKISDGMRY